MVSCLPGLCVPGSKPDSSKTGGKKGVKIVQDPHYRRYGCTVDMDFALETFRPHRSVACFLEKMNLCSLHTFTVCLHLHGASNDISV